MPTEEEARLVERGEFASPVVAATIAAAGMVAQHVIGKATRDAMFLSHFSVERLPLVVIAGAFVSGAVVFLMTRLIQRWGPARVVPAAFAWHGVAMVIEWLAAWRFPSAIAVVWYLHSVSVSATVISAFWSVVGEAFDPHAAKQVIGRIGAGAAIGGVLGGLVAWVGSKITGVPTMLLVMAAFSFAGAWGARALARGTHAEFHEERERALTAKATRSPLLAALRETPYLRLLALTVLLGAATASLVEYGLSFQATAIYGSGERLLSFFAIVQTAISAAAFLLQLAANRLALERLGVGATLALLPGGVVVFGTFALAIPSLLSSAILRGVEGVLHASFFHSAYEVLFTPVPQALKRPTKTSIDVTFDRLGMTAGSALTLGLIAWSPEGALRAVTVAAVALAAAELFVAYRLHHGYLATLADRLRSGALHLEKSSVIDVSTRRALTQMMAAATPPTARDERVRLMADLRSADTGTVRRALQQAPSNLAPHALDLLGLLGRDELAADAMRALAPLVPSIVGTITDVVLDKERPLAVRRRAARLMRAVASQRAADSLAFALDDSELDVRHACGRVLVAMRERNSELRFDAGVVFARARRELEATETGAPDLRGIEHAFNVLALTFPREPMQLAYGALASRDSALRGIALEYLDVVLPPDLRAALARRLESRAAGSAHPSPAPRPSARSLADLVNSREAIRSSLAELRLDDPDPDPPKR